MDKKLYDIVYNAITTQFGAGDYIESGDREACAEMIVQDLRKAGYRNINEAWVEKIDPKEDTLADVIERVIGEIDRARKETAKEIYNMLLGHELQDNGEGDMWSWVINADDIRFIAEKYDLEVDDNGGQGR